MLVSDSTVRKGWFFHLAAGIFLCQGWTSTFVPISFAQQCSAPGPASQPVASGVFQSAEGLPREPSADTGNAARASPLVSLEDDQLTIAATNASLSEILEEVRVCTGADLDTPPEASGERVTVHLGPGPPRKVLSDLLVWTKFDYIIQASAENPLSIQTIVLMQDHKREAATVAETPTNANREVTSAPTRAPENSVSLPEPSEANAAPSPSAAPPAGTEHPMEVQAKALDLGSSAGANASKSTTEIIQQLQQMYQERKALQLLRMNARNSSPPGN